MTGLRTWAAGVGDAAGSEFDAAEPLRVSARIEYRSLGGVPHVRRPHMPRGEHAHPPTAHSSRTR